MNRIKKLFSTKKENILNIYFTAGFPRLESTEEIITALDKAGVDLIEIGMPYSDPLADGTTIQESGQQAIANGMTLPILFDQLKEARKQTELPFILMGYFNQVMQYGEQKFVDDCLATGVDGLILPDLPLYEYEQHYQKMLETAGLSISFLITPQTSDDRIRKVDELSQGFIYMVSSASITGSSTGMGEEHQRYFERIEAMQLATPRLIGFGISDYQTYSMACAHASGAIIGSAYIRALQQSGAIEQITQTFIQKIRKPASVKV